MPGFWRLTVGKEGLFPHLRCAALSAELSNRGAPIYFSGASPVWWFMQRRHNLCRGDSHHITW